MGYPRNLPRLKKNNILFLGDVTTHQGGLKVIFAKEGTKKELRNLRKLSQPRQLP